MRAISELNVAEAAKKESWIVDFVTIIGDETNTDKQLRLCTHMRNIVVGSDTYTASGELLGFSNISDDLDVKNNSLTVSLSGVNSSISSLVLTNNIEGSPVEIRRGYFNKDTGALVDDPYIRWEGFINNFSIVDNHSSNDSDTIDVSISCKSLLATILGAKYGRYTSPTSIGDGSMDFVASLKTASFSFGEEEE